MSWVICCDYKLVYVCGNNNGKEKLEWSALICYFNFGLNVTNFVLFLLAAVFSIR